MATTTADKRSAPTTPRRPLWQVPLFVLGLAAFAAAWFCRPLFPADRYRGMVRDLSSARAALAKPDGNVEYALKLATRALEVSKSFPDSTPEAAFLAGSLTMRVAEKTGPRGEQWFKARSLLEQASESGAGLQDEQDRHQLKFRLAKVGTRTRMEPGKIADYLEESAAHADNRPDAYSMLTRAYLALTPPDLERALKANHRLRELQEITATDLAAAQLQGGEILLRLGRPGEARKSLEKIDDRAPADTLLRARLLRARTHQEEKEWEQAASQYAKALADGRQVPDAALARYYLGMCYRRMDNKPEAGRAWQQCLSTAKGPEAVAAAVALADLHLVEPALEPALGAIEQAMARCKPGEKWNNPFVQEVQLTDLLARARTAFQQAERPDLMYKLTAHQVKYLDPAKALLARAEAAANWGKQLAAKGPESAAQAKTLLEEAGTAYEQAADLPGLKPDEQAEYLYQSAMSYLAGQDRTKGASALFRMATLEGKPERMGEACYRLAEHYRETGEKKKAEEKYQDCMKYSTRFEYLARFRLAMAYLENGDLDNAQAALVYNLKMLRWEDEPDATAESLFAVSNLLYQKREYIRVVHYLEDLLGRAKDSPKYRDSPDLTRSRFQLADAYRQIAARELMGLIADSPISKEAKEHRESQQRLYLQRAAEEFIALNAFLETPAGEPHLTKEQRVQVPFNAAKCLFNLGKYKEALEVYDKLAQKHANKVEGLDALGGAVQCHAAMLQEDEIRQRLLQIEQGIEQVEKADPKVGEVWRDWVKRAREPLKPIKE
jgi:tetratricopeptide (TPR) repeat protein